MPQSPDHLHRSSGRHGLGFGLAACTMLLWGVLPLALQGVLRVLDAATITWFRFALASAVLLVFLGARGGLPPLRALGSGARALLAAATLFLCANYLTYLYGLDRTGAASAQVLIQLAPLLLGLGGVLVFRERFRALQWAGFAVLFVGLAVFSGAKLRGLAEQPERYLLGIGCMLVAALTWAIYGLAQKQLLRWLSSQGIMLCIYAGCSLLLLPLARPGSLLTLTPGEWAILLFCALNTLVAYGTFAEALVHWEASRVSAVLALTPLATLAFVALGARWLPGLVVPEPLTWITVAGACLVVGGSLLTSLGGRAGDGPLAEGGPGQPVR